MTRGRAGLLLAAALACGLPASARADIQIEAASTTRFQLRQELNGERTVPLYEDLYGHFTIDLPKQGSLSALALVKLGTVLVTERGDVDLYLLSLTWRRSRHRFELSGGRQFLRTAVGSRMVDGASLRVRPLRPLTVEAAVGWLRDSERDDFRGGAFLAQGGVRVSALPGTQVGALLGFVAGPDTAPRLDGRFHGYGVLPIPLAPRFWIDSSLRLSEPELRSLRGGVVLTPIWAVSIDIEGRIEGVVDEEGVLAREVLSGLTASPAMSLGGGATLRAVRGLTAGARYRAVRYLVNADYVSSGHAVDARVAWIQGMIGLQGEYIFRSSYGGVFHGLGGQVLFRPHPVLTLRVRGQVAPYRKLLRAWTTAQWWLGEVAVAPVPQVELRVGGEFRAGGLEQHDLRLNAAVDLRGVFRRRQ